RAADTGPDNAARDRSSAAGRSRCPASRRRRTGSVSARSTRSRPRGPGRRTRSRGAAIRQATTKLRRRQAPRPQSPQRTSTRAAADEAHVGIGVLAEHRHLAAGAAEDALRTAVVARDVDRLRRAGEQLDAVGLDQHVDHECTPRLPLTVQTMAAVDEERVGPKPITHLPACAATFHRTQLSAGSVSKAERTLSAARVLVYPGSDQSCDRSERTHAENL